MKKNKNENEREMKMDREVPTATNLEIRKFHCCFFLEFRVIIVCENLILKKKKVKM